jgi:ADP-heptose:LPS heptosyltransferase
MSAPVDLTVDPRRIVVLRALYLGDLLCATPALRALRKRFPRAEITLIGLPWAQALVDRLDSVDRLLAFPGYPGLNEAPYDAARTAAFLADARAARYDLAIQMHGDGGVSNGFVAALGAQTTLGYRPDERPDERLTWSIPYGAITHEVERWLGLAALLGSPTDDRRLECPVTPADRDEAAALLAAATDYAPGAGPLVGLHVGAKDAARRWPVERFAALGDALAERCGATIVLTGSAGEQPLTAAVCAAMNAPALDLAGRTSLGGLAALIERLDLLVTNDTGASHVAAARGVRSVVLFGPSRPEQWAPLDRARHCVIDAQAFAPGVDPAQALPRLDLDPALAACLECLKER